MLHAVIMAGGSGTRFWPLSRRARPKQLLALATPRPLLVETVARLEGLVPAKCVTVVTNAAYATATRRLLPGVPERQVVAEPVGRDTAPCIGLAATLIARRDPDAVLVVLPADHVVRPEERFRAALSRAAEVAVLRPEALCTLGVAPRHPATGYGYIERGEPLGELGGVPYHAVSSFREKPDLETARGFVAAGRFWWNAGIFVFRAAAMLARLEQLLPDLHRGLGPAADAILRDGVLPEALYAAMPKISIDYGVMERARDVVVLEADFDWDDVGSFAALDRVLEPDDSGNRGSGARTLQDARNNVVLTGDDHHVALIGVEDLIVVHTPDATLVCRKTDAERVKELVARLEEQGRSELV